MTLDLGTTSLAQVRIARGLTLEDAERSTRISRKFLIALEEHDYSVFPAPVYARGFLRTYCRYLGVDPEAQLAELPPGWTESTLPTTPMEPVSTRQPMTFNFAWLAIGALVVAIIGIALFLNRGSSGLDELAQGANEPNGQAPAGAVAGESTGSNNSQSPAASPTQTSSSTRRTLNPGLPGVLPDFENVDADEAMAFLDQQDIPYLRIDTTSRTVPAGLVVSQSPAAGSDTDDIDQVTLTVSTGASPAQTNRTDCDVLSASNQRTAAEQAYFENNCAEDEQPAALPDRTSCEQIRGTDYRSPQERTFFLTNCIIQ